MAANFEFQRQRSASEPPLDFQQNAACDVRQATPPPRDARATSTTPCSSRKHSVSTSEVPPNVAGHVPPCAKKRNGKMRRGMRVAMQRDSGARASYLSERQDSEASSSSSSSATIGTGIAAMFRWRSAAKPKSDDNVLRRMSVEEFLRGLRSESPNCPRSARGKSKDGIWGAFIEEFDDLELRIQICSATELRAPEYRVGDFIRGSVLGEESLLRGVYIEFDLDGQTHRTSTTSRMKNEGRNVYFDEEKTSFAYAGEREVRVAVRNQRNLAAVVRGDPLIGEGVLKLSTEWQDFLPRERIIPLTRCGLLSGSVMLRCQLFSAAGEACKAQQDAVTHEITAFSEAADAAADTGNFMRGLIEGHPSFTAYHTASFERMMAADFR